MSEPTNEQEPTSDREPGEVGIRDEDLPEDLQPTDDNPLAQNPDDQDEQEDGDTGETSQVEGMPDMGNPAG
jgi:hypothetical protein